MCHVLGRVAALAQGAREARELVGGFGSDGGARHARLQPIGRMEHRFQNLPRLEIGQLLDIEAIHAFHRIGEVGMYLDRLQVRDHQQRRVVELQELLKNVVPLVLGNADSGVPHLQCHPLTAPTARNQHAAPGGVAQRIGDEVAHHQAHQ